MIIHTDPIADMLARIRNAALVNKRQVEIPFSKMKLQIAERLKVATYIGDFTVQGEGIAKAIVISLSSDFAGPRITKIARLSSPGRRLYAKSKNIPRVKSGRGIVLVSTSRGIMTGEQAKAMNIGGELICEVY